MGIPPMPSAGASNPLGRGWAVLAGGRLESRPFSGRRNPGQAGRAGAATPHIRGGRKPAPERVFEGCALPLPRPRRGGAMRDRAREIAPRGGPPTNGGPRRHFTGGSARVWWLSARGSEPRAVRNSGPRHFIWLSAANQGPILWLSARGLGREPSRHFRAALGSRPKVRAEF